MISGCVNPPAYCGNRVCEQGEDQYTCSQDCQQTLKTCQEQNGITCNEKENCSQDWTSASDTSRCCLGACSTQAVCGNEIIDENEQCDSTNLGGKLCKDLGFDGGGLYCKDCQFDTSECYNFKCGDGIKQGIEVCDSNDLSGQTCQTQGFISGTLGCSTDCKSFDTSKCTSDLRLFLPFETDVLDKSGLGNNGIIVGSAAIENDPVRGKVLVIDRRANSYVKIPKIQGNESLNFGKNTNFTVMLWAKALNTGDTLQQAVLANAYYDVGPGFGIYRDRFYVTDGDIRHTSPISPPPNQAFSAWLGNLGGSWMDGNWHHLAYTVERAADSIKIITIIDGGLRNYTVTYPNSWTDYDENTPKIDVTATRDLLIGTTYGAYQSGSIPFSGTFNGRIDNLKIYGRQLSLSEIQNIYSAEINIGRNCQPTQVVCNGNCTTPYCFSSSECNDNNPSTIDSCQNPGACNAICISTGREGP
ncbi:MAG: LamG-like jellyroll fold domain-containing protein [Candidatus Diapherotrites archaeon]|nr:LamG-like jellyroll fold domain-containing protein [Candidatus Diapherotrites archaeon]